MKGISFCSTLATALMCAMVSDTSTYSQSIAGASQRSNSQTTGEARLNITDTATVRQTPEYPALAKAARVSGKVDVEVVVDIGGNVKSARAILGHPLLKDAAVACARQWKFPSRSATDTEIIGIVTIVFDLRTDQPPKSLVGHSTLEREADLRVARQCVAGKPTDTKMLTLALARLAVSALDEKTVDEAIDLFEQCEKANKLPKGVQAYYGKLLYEKHIYNRELLSVPNERANTSIDGYLSRALQLFLEAYSYELEAKPIDSRKLSDIVGLTNVVYAAMGKSEERFGWMRVVLNSPGLADDDRANFNYDLAVSLWKKSYDLSYPYVSHNQPVPEEYFSQIRELLDEAFPLMHSAQALAPTFANPWFYEKLLVIEELKIETDPSRRELLNLRAMELQDRYLELQRSGRVVNNNRGGPYASGLPSLNREPTHLLPSPPPPPPPPPRE